MDTPSWRHIVGGTAGVALLGAVGYFGQARIRTDKTPQKFVSKGSKKSNPTTGRSTLIYSPDRDQKLPLLVKKIKVDIVGEIVKPGVYELTEGQRIEDLIKLAGGLKKSADRASVNFALKLKDEQKVVVPAKPIPGAPKPLLSNRKAAPNVSSPLPGDSSRERLPARSNRKQPPANPISINSASEIDFQTLPGIGPSMARKILDYRTENGDFSQIEDLRKVKGMGEKLFEKIREWITL